MGTIHFLIPQEKLDSGLPEVQSAYMSGIDGHIFPTRHEFTDGGLQFTKPAADSCKLNIAWPVEGFGRPIVRTASLSERQSNFVLTVELARGKLSEIKDQKATWENSGMSMPAEYLKLEKEAFQLFRQAACSQDEVETASQMAEQSLVKAFHASDTLLRSYIAQRLAFRRQRAGSPAVLIGCFLTGSETPENVPDDFTALGIPLNWKHIEVDEGKHNWKHADAIVEHCLEHRVLSYGGPLLDLAGDGLPDWVNYYQHDPAHLQDVICGYVETVTSRYLGRVRHWEVVARANSGGVSMFNEEGRLTLAARVIDIARQIDDENQLFLRVDQPWGAYQAKGMHRLSPFQFVDALLRSGIGLSGVNLEIAVGYQMIGAGFRDPFDLSRLIDLWSTLGVPLYVTFAVPSSTQPDPAASNRMRIIDQQWKWPWSDEAQARWIEQILPLLLAKQAIVGVFCSHLSDDQPHVYPHAGLVRADQTAKPSLQAFLQRGTPG